MYLVPDRIDAPLHVVTTVFNPVRFKSRWKLYQRFAKYVKDSGAILHTVEVTFGERSPAIAPTDGPHTYTQLRTTHELWLKENVTNLGFARVPLDAKYIAWVDADVAFARPNWVGETIHQLQHYPVVQMFSHAQDLGPNYEPLGPLRRSFMDCYVNNEVLPTHRPGDYYYYYGKGASWHPGFAWAARREALDSLGGLVDFSILGAGDQHMAHGLIGQMRRSIHPKLHPRYAERLLEWEYRAERDIRRNVGVVSGLLLHYWHGKKVNRRYQERWKILLDGQYNPDTDIKPDASGLYQLCDRDDARTLKLRDDIRRYFRQRNEDGIDV